MQANANLFQTSKQRERPAENTTRCLALHKQDASLEYYSEAPEFQLASFRGSFNTVMFGLTETAIHPLEQNDFQIFYIKMNATWKSKSKTVVKLDERVEPVDAPRLDAGDVPPIEIGDFVVGVGVGAPPIGTGAVVGVGTGATPITV